ncbi:MAG: Tim44/TimA family putative adaptor protein [Anaplasma sp.]
MVELAIYAFVAAFIFFRLYSSLGKASSVSFQSSCIQPENIGDELAESDANSESPDVPIDSVIEGEFVGQASSILAAIKERCRDFSIRHFMEGSAAAFELIVKALNEGNTGLLSSLLNSRMYESFVKEIERRKDAGHVHEDVVVAITSQKITAAELVGNLATITVRFITEQINVVRNTAGEIVEGSVSKINVIEDTWKFEKDVTATARRWYLASTAASS